jgi:hypothetical protein
MRFIPRFPAILLVPAVLAAWAVRCAFPQVILGEHYYSYGFPLRFYGWVEHRTATTWGAYYAGFRLGPFLVDLLLASGVAWLSALCLEWLLFRNMHSARKGTEPSNKVTGANHGQR